MVPKRGDGPRREIRPGDILTLGDFAARAAHRLDFERGADVRVDPTEVPADLRPLIPLVERWAIAGSAPQQLFIDHLRAHAPAEVDAFVDAVRPALQDIRGWIRESIDELGVRNVPAAVSQFAYAVSAYELAKPPDPEVRARDREKRAAFLAAKQLRTALHDAADAMREKRYEDVVRLLQPHESELSGSSLKKLQIARKRAAD